MNATFPRGSATRTALSLLLAALVIACSEGPGTEDTAGTGGNGIIPMTGVGGMMGMDGVGGNGVLPGTGGSAVTGTGGTGSGTGGGATGSGGGPGETTMITIEENAPGYCNADGTIDSNHTGFMGSGFVNSNNAIGAGITWRVNGGSSSYVLTWRYANGGTSDRPGQLLVDGTTASTVSFPATGAWTTWSEASTTVELGAGAHTFRLEATVADGLVNLDSLTITGLDVVPGDCVLAFCDAYPGTSGWQSDKVFYNEEGRLEYSSDAEQNRIPDYSYAGYHYGEDPLPTLPVVATIDAIDGDNTAHIQAALDQVGDLTPDANGHRGALLLNPGTYEVNGIVQIKDSGVVLRGSGDGTDPATNTIIFARGDNPHQRVPLAIGTKDGSPWDEGSSTDVTDAFVPVGSMSMNVENAGMFSVGDEVIVLHPSSQAWIDALDGGGVTTGSWSAGSKDIRFVRKITAINGSEITLDAPIFEHLNGSLTQAEIIAVTNRNLIAESGIENLRVDIETAGGEDENHAWSAIEVYGAEDSWVQNVTARYFGYAGVNVHRALRITVKDVIATDPIGIRTGGRFYNFAVGAYAQLVLFTGCTAADGRHNFVSNGTTTASGVVWHRCTSTGGTDSEGHRHWTTGMLFDAITGSGSRLKLINRGDWGTQHGWGSAHSTAWNSVSSFYIQKPPTAQNYGISGLGSESTNYAWPGPGGYTDIRDGEVLNPESLYEAQLCDRLKN